MNIECWRLWPIILAYTGTSFIEKYVLLISLDNNKQWLVGNLTCFMRSPTSMRAVATLTLEGSEGHIESMARSAIIKISIKIIADVITLVTNGAIVFYPFPIHTQPRLNGQSVDIAYIYTPFWTHLRLTLCTSIYKQIIFHMPVCHYQLSTFLSSRWKKIL